MNMSKCEYLSVETERKDDLRLDGEVISEVERVKYVEVWFNKFGNCRDEVTE